MPTECNPGLFDFAAVEGRQVVAGFDGGVITSDAGALLLGATDRAIRLTERFTACFADRRAPELVEHSVWALVVQRVFGIALSTRISSITMSSGTIRYWRCWPGNLRHAGRIVQRWPARAH